MKDPRSRFLSRPSVLSPVDAPKAWGWEKWLTSTRPEAPARLEGGSATLADRIKHYPEALGHWARRLFGEEMPIFTKLIHTDFPERVHLGFRRAPERGQFLAWLTREQDLMRAFLPVLRVPDGQAFAEYQARYSRWATDQALAAWRREDDGAAHAELAPFVDPSFDLRGWLESTRANRAALVDTLNEIDLRREAGHLLLSAAGVVHAIFGLSHQTHPVDPARRTLERLFESLGERAAASASDDDLARLIEDAGLTALRGQNQAPPKNEAWLATTVSGKDVLVEPQQTSDTTYSLADFYTPFTWGPSGARFRKGEPLSGLSREKLTEYLKDVVFDVTALDTIRRSPRLVPEASCEGAALSCLVDEPASWPFFTAYQVDLTDRIALSPPPGVFQQLIVARGRVELADELGAVGELSPEAPAFVPGSMKGSYVLSACEPSTVFVFAVPGARGGSPRSAPLPASPSSTVA
jgi:hypothetical protein